MSENQKISQWMYSQVDKSNLTHESLAELTGYSNSAVFRWITGQRLPKLVNLIGLCEVFAMKQGRSPSQLVFEALLNLDEMVYAEKRWKKRIEKVENE